MSRYIQFPTDDGSILVEVTENAVIADQQRHRVGIGDAVRQVIDVAQEKVDAVIKASIRSNVTILLAAIAELPEPPDETELSFSLKATGETGALSWGVAKLGAEANYGIKIVWKRK